LRDRRSGVPTETIDRFIFEYGMDHGAIPATLNYRGYTKILLHVDQPCGLHGIPETGPLPPAEGDVNNRCGPSSSTAVHGDPSRMYRSPD